MSRRICALGWCHEPRRAGILCQRHYARWKAGGSLEHPSPREKTVTQRFWEKVDLDGECWLWLGSKNSEGYGRFWNGKRYVPAHRYALEERQGYPVREDLQVDHLCLITSCVRPDHLEAVSPRINTLRGSGPAAQNARKTECGKCGKPYDSVGGKGERACRRCNLDRDNAARRLARARKKGSASCPA